MGANVYDGRIKYLKNNYLNNVMLLFVSMLFLKWSHVSLLEQ